MNHHLLDCNIIVKEPNRTSVQLAEKLGEGGKHGQSTGHWDSQGPEGRALDSPDTPTHR